MRSSIIKKFKAKALVISVSAVTAMLIAAPVLSATEVEEIQVTGTRIKTTDGMATPTPVTALSTSELNDFNPGGTVAEQLDNLPQFFNTQTAQRGGGALFGSAGGSFLNMRNLGQARTLVLLDGSRVVPGDKSGSVNVDTLPNALLKTVDVVTGGASAAYGADAIGGVTNFIIDRKFQGFKATVGTGITEMGDGKRENLSLAFGHKFGEKLNIIGSVDSKHIDQIERSAADMSPDFYQRWGWVGNPAFKASDPAGTNPQYLIKPWVHSTIQSPYGLIVGANVGPALASPSAVAAGAPAAVFAASGLSAMKFTKDGSGITPFIKGDYYTTSGQATASGGPEGALHNEAFSVGGANGQEVVGRSFFLGGEYLLTDKITLTAQAMAGRSESNSASSRAGYEMEAPWTVTVFRDNPYLPANVAAIMDTNKFTALQVNKVGSFMNVPEIGSGQRDHNVLTTQSWALGFDADLNDKWSLKGNFQDGTSGRNSTVINKLRSDRMFLAADAVRDPKTGNIVCRVSLVNPTPAQLAASPSIKGLYTSVEDNLRSLDGTTARKPLYSPIGLDAGTISGCVPYDVMGNGNITSGTVNYVGTTKTGLGWVKQTFSEVLLTGEVYKGWGYGPVSVATGVNYRKQSFHDGSPDYATEELGPPRNDPALGIQGIPAGIALNGSPNLHQFSTTPEIYGGYNVKEMFAELQSPFWRSQSGNQSIGGSVAYRDSNYSTSGHAKTWKAGVDIQLYSDLRVRATRSKDVREPTFSERFDSQGGGGSVNDPSKPSLGSIQITTVVVGNPNLKPEFANTEVIGFVYQPSFLSGVQLSSDWYKVAVTGAIGSLGTQRIVNDCVSGVAPALCANVERDDAGIIGRVFNPYLNVASAFVMGVDTELAYKMEPNLFNSLPEKLALRLLYGHVTERSNVSVVGAASIDIVGGVGAPKNTATLVANYDVGAWGLQLSSRWIDTVRLSKIGGGGVLALPGVDFDNPFVSSHVVWNGQLSYKGQTKSGADWSVGLAVQNILNENPPIIASVSSRGGTQNVSDTYDAEGRRYALNVNYKF